MKFIQKFVVAAYSSDLARTLHPSGDKSEWKSEWERDNSKSSSENIIDETANEADIVDVDTVDSEEYYLNSWIKFSDISLLTVTEIGVANENIKNEQIICKSFHAG